MHFLGMEDRCAVLTSGGRKRVWPEEKSDFSNLENKEKRKEKEV